MAPTINLNVHNFQSWRARPRQAFEGIRFDANNDCNIHCAYCHIPRSKDLIDLGEFRAFLAETVDGTDLFQFGCQMEPTLDERLVVFMQAVGESAAKPRQRYRLQTNGILLHRHDHDKMCEAGLNFLTVSMDSVDPGVVRKLRGGTSLNKVYRNVEEFHRHCPTVRIGFITTVTSVNIGAIDDLVEAGLRSGVAVFNLRQVAYTRSSAIVDHALMKTLTITTAAFLEMVDRVRGKYGKQASFSIQTTEDLSEGATRTSTASGLPPAHFDHRR